MLGQGQRQKQSQGKSCLSEKSIRGWGRGWLTFRNSTHPIWRFNTTLLRYLESRLSLPRLLALRHRSEEKASLMWQLGPALSHDKYLSVLVPPALPANRLLQATSLSLCTGLHRAPLSSSCLSGTRVTVRRMVEGRARSSRGRFRLASDLRNSSPSCQRRSSLPSSPGTYVAPSHRSLATQPAFSLNSDTAEDVFPIPEFQAARTSYN